ncbi:hypothetical protein AB0B89_30950 [Sphaerisporangium sp. NPDC049002]|uniref:hypothetical protein n=1 Tax=Sphaerisporangium sp. NPDC049002 TaxID=3155392 RepID=UPI00340BF7D4
MKFKTKKTIDYREIDVNGQKAFVPHERTYRVPDAGADWNMRRWQALTAGTAAVVLISIVWSATNIVDLLQTYVPFPVALVAAGVIDVVWVLFMLLEYNLRTDAHAQAGPRRMGWFILALSALAVFYHGFLAGDLITATIGAFISVAVKILWSYVMKSHVRKLSPEAQTRLSIALDQAYAEGVKAEVEGAVARKRAVIAARLAAMEIEQAEYPVDIRVDRAGTQPEYPDTRPEVSLAPPQARGVSAPDIHPSAPGLHRISTQDEGVSALVGLIRSGKTPTISEAMDITGKPYTTAQRWLAKAKDQAQEGTGLYL